MRHVLTTLLVTLPLLSGFAVANPPDADHVLLSGRGVEVTVQDLWDHLDENGTTWTPSASAEVTRRNLRRVIGEIFTDRLEARDWEASDLAHTRLGWAIQTHCEQRAAADWVRQRVLPADFRVTDEEVSRELERRADRFRRPDTLMVRHIYLDLVGAESDEARESKRALAEEISAILAEDPSRFAELRDAHTESSTDVDILGPLRTTALALSISEILWQCGEGEITSWIENSAGLHLFQVVERRSDSVPAREARAQIQSELRDAFVRDQVQSILASAPTELGLTLEPLPEEFDPAAPLVSGGLDLSLDDVEALGIGTEQIPEADSWRANAEQVQENAALWLWAQHRGTLDTPAMQSAVTEAWSQRRREVLMLEVRRAIVHLDEAQLRSHYEEHREDFRQPLAMRLNEIRSQPQAGEVVNQRAAEAEAQALWARWQAGEDFDTLLQAQIEATGQPASAAERWIYPMDLDAARFADFAEMSVGDVSSVYRTAQGYAFARVEEIDQDVIPPLERLRHDLTIQLSRNLPYESRQQWWADLRADLNWDIPDELIQMYVTEEE